MAEAGKKTKGSTLRRVLTYVRPQARLMVLSLLFSLFTVLLTLYIPILIFP